MTLFKQTETVNNEQYYVEVFESTHYNVNVVKNKEFNYTRIEVEKNNNIEFIPYIYVDGQDEGFEIKIQTTSYGALDEKDFTSFLHVQNKVAEYVAEIKNIIAEVVK